MRRFAILCLLTAGILWGATPATAQRDPFDPLVSENGGAATPAPDTTAPADDTAPSDTTDEAAPAPDEPMPGTGGEPSPWVGLATLLMALGGGLLVLVKVLASRTTGSPARR